MSAGEVSPYTSKWTPAAPSPPYDFALPSTTSATISLDRFRGRVPVLLVFLANHPEAATVTERLAEAQVELAHRRVQLLVVARGSITGARALVPGDSGLVVLADGSGSVTSAFGAETGDAGQLLVVSLDINGREVGRSAVTAEVIAEHLLRLAGNDPHDGASPPAAQEPPDPKRDQASTD